MVITDFHQYFHISEINWSYPNFRSANECWKIAITLCSDTVNYMWLLTWPLYATYWPNARKKCKHLDNFNEEIMVNCLRATYLRKLMIAMWSFPGGGCRRCKLWGRNSVDWLRKCLCPAWRSGYIVGWQMVEFSYCAIFVIFLLCNHPQSSSLLLSGVKFKISMRSCPCTSLQPSRNPSLLSSVWTVVTVHCYIINN